MTHRGGGLDTPPQAAIEDHGVIGDLHTAALVATNRDNNKQKHPRIE